MTPYYLIGVPMIFATIVYKIYFLEYADNICTPMRFQFLRTAWPR